MIKPLLIFLFTYFLMNGFLREAIKFKKPILPLWIDRQSKWISDWLKGPRLNKLLTSLEHVWVVNGLLSFVCVIALSYLFNSVNLLLVLAAVFISGFQYVANVVLRRQPQNNTLAHYFLYQTVHLLIIYFILFLFKQTGNPKYMFDQMYILLFSKNLQVDSDIILPAILLVLVFLISVASDFIATFLNLYNDPITSAQNETAATLELLSEDIKSKKGNLKNGMLADMSVEEKMEVIMEEKEEGPHKKITESIKIEYQIQQTEDNSSRGKYIGILERILICIFVFYEVYQGLMLLGAMKTLARFKLFENKAFAEHYLIGTLLSLIIAIMCGFLLQRLLSEARLI